MTLYLITGKKRAGKDTAANIIGCPKVSLAEPIKDIYRMIFGENITDENKSEKNRFGFIRREWLQWFGTEVMQHEMMKRFPGYTMNRNIWVFNAMMRMNRVPGCDYVISDVRFPHEVETLKIWANTEGHKVIVIRIISDRAETGDNHASETEMKDIIPDITIENNGTIEELKEKILNIINHE